MNIYIPTAEFCFGRDEIAQSIINLTLSEGTTILFGGRQSGKTTLLLNIQKKLLDEIKGKPSSLDMVIPVYVNLLKLSYDSTPEKFFFLLIDEVARTVNELVEDIPYLPDLSLNQSRDSLKFFEDNIALLLECFSEKHVSILFLVDEAGKLFGGNYTAGINDNLFYAIYVSEKISGNVSIVFSGSQELYSLIEDKGTSPLGSRANLEYLRNLKENFVEEMIFANINLSSDEEKKKFSKDLFEYSGGHAGICAYIVKHYMRQKEVLSLETIIGNFLDRHGQLFNIWLRSLSPEAVVLQNDLLRENILDVSSISKILFSNNVNSLYSDWALKQILFTGIGYLNNQKIMPNNLYANYIRQLEDSSEGLDEDTFEIEELLEKPINEFDSSDCSRMLDKLENGFRKLIAKRLSKLSDKWWKQRIPNEIRDRAEARKQERERSYPGMVQQNRPLYDYLDFMDIPQIITMKLNWNETFKEIFNKQELVTIKIGEIGTFRNDIAHNRDLLPSDKELFLSNARQLLRTIRNAS